jgi:hypothetical protein
MKRSSWWYGAAACLLASGCGHEAMLAGSVPEPGTLSLFVSGPHEDNGAVMVAIRGPGLAAPTPRDPANVVYFLPAGAGAEARVIVVGPHLSGALVTMAVPDVRRANEYSASVLEVADQLNQVRADVTGYRAVLAGSLH